MRKESKSIKSASCAKSIIILCTVLISIQILTIYSLAGMFSQLTKCRGSKEELNKQITLSAYTKNAAFMPNFPSTTNLLETAVFRKAKGSDRYMNKLEKFMKSRKEDKIKLQRTQENILRTELMSEIQNMNKSLVSKGKFSTNLTEFL